ncbi:hypothetical protein [Dechloromonas sp. A34]|uniref:hypothetical protein n=1 Tax=Dechloromonas sp. A34 TaxID=447588 RepID=UPI00224944CB|nr:hypothetical protein [Dechloromonas sp. A34]
MKIQIKYEDHSFPVIQVIANPDFPKLAENTESEKAESGADVHINSSMNVSNTGEGNARYLCELRINVDRKESPKAPYFIEMLSLCYLQIETSGQIKDLERLAADAAHRMLYPAIREMILNLTARQPWGKFSIGLSTLNSEPAEQASNTQPQRKRIRTSKAAK